MRPSTRIIWLFVCVFVCASEEDLFMDTPVISVPGQPADNAVTLDPGTNFSLICASENPITWKQFKGFTGTHQVTYAEVEDTELRYRSMIHLINITYHYVGFYYCVTNKTASHYNYSVAFVFEGIAKKRLFSGVNEIYVFVNDTDNQLVNSKFSEMTVVDGKFLILTCKPTSDDTSIKLYERGEEVLDFHRYYSRMGFVFQFYNASEIYGKSYTCRPNNYLQNSNAIMFNVTYHIPTVQSSTGLYGTKGGKLTLNCSIDILKDENIAIKWTLPNNRSISSLQNRAEESLIERKPNPMKSDLWIGVRTLTINDIDVQDEGYYKCEVIDHLNNRSTDEMYIEVLKEDDRSIDIYTLDGKYKIEVSKWKGEAIWKVRYRGEPKPSLEWYDHSDQIITGDEYNDKYKILISHDHIVLTIMHLSGHDSGNYTLKASNSLDSKEMKFELLVRDIPDTSLGPSMEQNVYMVTFRCQYSGYPRPKIMWKYTPCETMPKWPTCDEKRRTRVVDKYIQPLEEYVSGLSLNASEFGLVQCFAINAEGIMHSEGLITKVYDPTEVDIRLLTADTTIVRGDNITITCEAPLKYQKFYWRKDNDLIYSDNVRTVEITEERPTEGFQKLTISWTGIRNEDAGTYKCVAGDNVSDVLEIYADKKIEIHEPSPPKIQCETYVEEKLNHNLGTSFQLRCNIYGLPVPKIKWFKDNKIIANGTRILLADELGQILEIKSSEMEDEGTYKCVGENRLANATKSFNLRIIDKQPYSLSVYWMIGFVVLMLALVAVIIDLYTRFQRVRRELQFEKGNPDRINPEIALHEQANLLPYNKKFEFPRKKLKLGKQLGIGTFGIVVEGLANGIIPNVESTIVAVKMLKGSAGNEEVSALVTELKIMANLGQHLNIVNLLGAVTKNMARNGLMVIVEYCRLGNVQTFLIEHRNSFVDQINPINDSIDPSVTMKQQNSLPDVAYEYLSNGTFEQRNRNLINHAETSFITDPTSDRSSTAEKTFTLTTSDLVCWSFQVASGMKYLSSRRVLHGDLAARNVLLSDGNVVKICDFGLARSLWKCDFYKKEDAALLPFKWLAIESVCDRVFSTFSDIWSFGILLWELFSLGATPYPGQVANLELFNKLKDGYRMEKAKYATQEIHEIMLDCWNFNPESRPLFSDLEERLKKILESGVAEHYIDLNGQYVEMNARNLGEGQIDFLARMAPPENCSLSIMQSDAVSTYLSMRPITK